MADRTRPSTEAALAFSAFVEDWIGQFGCLLESVVLLRRCGAESAACASLLGIPEVVAFRHAWELWGLWSGMDREGLLRRTAPHLSLEVRALVSVGLFGEVEE